MTRLVDAGVKELSKPAGLMLPPGSVYAGWPAPDDAWNGPWTGSACSLVETFGLEEKHKGWFFLLRKPVRQLTVRESRFVCLMATGHVDRDVEAAVPTSNVFVSWHQRAAWTSDSAGMEQSTGGNDSIQRLAEEGRAALSALREEHPEWFKSNIEYPTEDFTPPDLSEVTVDLGE